MLFNFESVDGFKLTRNWLNTKDLKDLSALNDILAKTAYNMQKTGATAGQVSAELIDLRTTSNEYKNVLAQASPIVQQYQAQLDGTSDKLQLITNQTKNFSGALKGFLVNLGITLAVTAVFTGISYALDALITTTEEYQERFEKTKAEYDKIVQEYTELSEKKTTSPLDSPLTEYEKTRLEYLEQYKATLEETLAIDTRNTAKSKYFGEGDLFSGGISGDLKSIGSKLEKPQAGQFYASVNNTSEIDNLIKRDKQKAYAQLLEYYNSVTKELADIQADLQNEYIQEDESLRTRLESLSEYGQQLLDDLRQKIIEVVNSGEISSSRTTIFFNEDFKRRLEKDTRGLYELKRAFAGLTIDNVATEGGQLFESVANAAERAGVSTQDFINILYELGIITETVAQQTEQSVGATFFRLQDLVMDTTEEGKERLTEVKDLVDTALDFRSSVDQAEDAIKQLNVLLGTDFPLSAQDSATALNMIKAYLDGGAEGFQDYAVAVVESLGVKVNTKNIEGAITSLIAMLGTLEGAALQTGQAILYALAGTGLVNKIQTSAPEINEAGYIVKEATYGWELNQEMVSKFKSLLPNSKSKGGGGKSSILSKDYTRKASLLQSNISLSEERQNHIDSLYRDVADGEIIIKVNDSWLNELDVQYDNWKKLAEATQEEISRLRKKGIDENSKNNEKAQEFIQLLQKQEQYESKLYEIERKRRDLLFEAYGQIEEQLEDEISLSEKRQERLDQFVTRETENGQKIVEISGDWAAEYAKQYENLIKLADILDRKLAQIPETDELYNETALKLEDVRNRIYDMQVAAWEAEQKAKIDSIRSQIDALQNQVKQIDNQIKSLNRVRDNENKRWEAREKTLQHQIDYYESVISLEEAHYETIKSIRSELRALDNQLKIAKESYQYLDEETRKTLFNEDDYAELSGKLNKIAEEATSIYEDYYDRLANVTEATTYELAHITEEFQRQYNLKLKEYEVAKKELAVARARAELENVQKERNVAMLVDGRWQWVADPEAVKRAMESLYEAETAAADARSDYNHELKIQELEAYKASISLMKDAERAAHEAALERIEQQIEALERQKDYLELSQDMLNEQIKAIEKTTFSIELFNNTIATGGTLLGNAISGAIREIDNASSSAVSGIQRLLSEGGITWGNNEIDIDGFSRGGVIDYTGPAMVHGSPTRPEVAFDANDASKLYRLVTGADDLGSLLVGNMKDLFYKGLMGAFGQIPFKESAASYSNDNRIYIGNIQLSDEDSKALAILRNVALKYQP